MGTFRRSIEDAAPQASATIAGITFTHFIEKYVERCEPPVSKSDRGCLRKVAAFVVDGRALGDYELRILTEDTIEVFFAALRKGGRSASTRNMFIQAIKAAFRWATKKGYLDRNPTADADTLKREKIHKRDRRLTPDLVNEKGQITQDGEERRLLAVADTPATPYHRSDRDVLPPRGTPRAAMAGCRSRKARAVRAG